jgi:steroid delta-isomerase-like uncharacterized protein
VTAREAAEFFADLRRAYEKRDAAAIAAHYDDDCVVESPIGGTIAGRAAVERVARLTLTAFPDFRIDHEELLVFGDRVVEVGTVSGTDTGGFMGLPPTHKPFRVPSVFVFTLKNGRIVHERRSYDFSGFLLQLAGAVGPAVESARLYRDTLERAQLERDVRTAAEIQRALLPASRYRGAGFEIVGASVPCRAVGGDFFDYFELASGSFAFALGDVAGKGPPAALLTAVLQGMLAVHAHMSESPAETLRAANQTLTRRAVESRFATVVYCVLASDGRLRYASAGHYPPLLVSGGHVQPLEPGGLILGVFNDASYEENAIELAPGDCVVAFTDGITEAMNAAGDQFGDERLFSCVGAAGHLEPNAVLENLFDEIARFTGGAPQSDDMTALVVRYGRG